MITPSLILVLLPLVAGAPRSEPTCAKPLSDLIEACHGRREASAFCRNYFAEVPYTTTATLPGVTYTTSLPQITEWTTERIDSTTISISVSTAPTPIQTTTELVVVTIQEEFTHTEHITVPSLEVVTPTETITETIYGDKPVVYTRRAVNLPEDLATWSVDEIYEACKCLLGSCSRPTTVTETVPGTTTTVTNPAETTTIFATNQVVTTVGTLSVSTPGAFTETISEFYSITETVTVSTDIITITEGIETVTGPPAPPTTVTRYLHPSCTPSSFQNIGWWSLLGATEDERPEGITDKAGCCDAAWSGGENLVLYSMSRGLGCIIYRGGWEAVEIPTDSCSVRKNTVSAALGEGNDFTSSELGPCADLQ